MSFVFSHSKYTVSSMSQSLTNCFDILFRSSTENATRAYTLQTTFPTKVLDDDSKTVKEAGIAGAVVLQRWV